MKIQINTDRHISGNQEMIETFSDIVSSSLKRFSERITRIELHFSDENSKKKGLNDIKCVLEARLKGMEPVAVTDHSDSVEASLNGALNKMTSVLDSILGKLKNHL